VKWRLKEKYTVNEIKSLLLAKTDEVDKLLVKLTKRKREKTQIMKEEMRKGLSQQTPMKLRGLLGDASKTHILITGKSRRNF
jgi:hypothetical protein